MDTLRKFVRWNLIWIVPLLLATFLFFSPLVKPARADAYKISFQSLNGEYGNPLFTNGEFAEDEYGHRILVLFGTLTDSTFSISNLTDKASSTHYVVVNDLRVSSGGSTIPFIDDDGKVIVAPSTTPYNLLLSFPGENDSTSYSFYLYSLTELDNKVDGEETIDVVKGTYLGLIESFATTNQGSYTVNPKKINIVLDEDNIAECVTTDGDTTIIERTFGDAPTAITFKTQSGLAFDSHKMSTIVTIDGNDVYSDVGDYHLEVDNNNITITDANNVDITDYYKIVCDQVLSIRVNQLALTAPAHTSDNYFNDEKVVRDGDNNIVSTYFDKNPWQQENAGGHIGWTAYFQPRLQVTEEDLEDDRIKVSDEYLYYSITLKSVDAGGGRELSLSNFTLNYSDEIKDDYRTRIIKRPVTIYIAEHAAMTYPDELSIAILPAEFASNYGVAYSKIKTLDITIQSTPVTVTFEIKDFDLYALNDEILKQEDKLVLPVGNYPVINPFVENNDRYDITFDPNTFYTISPKPISIVDIVRDNANVTPVVREGDCFIVERYAYGEKEGSVVVDFEFKDTAISNTESFVLSATILLSDGGEPGCYTADQIASENFTLKDPQYLGVFINKVRLQLDYEATYEYARKAYAPTLTGGVDGLNFDYEIKFAKGKTYAEKNVLSAAPLSAGEYSFLVTLNEEGSNYYEFPNGKSTVIGFYTINKRGVNVRIIVKNDSKVFGEVVTMKDVAYFETTYSENSAQKGVLDGDEFGALSFEKDWNVKSAMPGDYAILNSFNNENYVIKSLKFVFNNKEYKQSEFKFHVYKLSLTNFNAQKATTINERKVSVTNSSIELPKISVYGVDLTGVVIAYRQEGEEEYAIGSSLKVTGLDEGTTYSVAYVVMSNNNLVDLNEDYLAESDSKSITTALTSPEIAQYPALTTSSDIAVELLNYDEANSYAYKVDDGEIVGINNADVSVLVFDEEEEEQTQKYVYIIEGLQPKTDYEIVFIRRTQYTSSDSETATMNTAAGVPSIDKADLEITSSSIKVNVKDGLIDEDEVIGYEIIKVNSGFMTFGSLSESNSELLAEYFAKNGDKAVSGEGVTVEGLDSDSIYYVKYYVVGNASNNYVQSDAIYFELHTQTLSEDPTRAEGIVGKISKYILFGSTVLFLILFIVCLIKFLSIKKKYRRA